MQVSMNDCFARIGSTTSRGVLRDINDSQSRFRDHTQFGPRENGMMRFLLTEETPIGVKTTHVDLPMGDVPGFEALLPDSAAPALMALLTA